MSMKQELAISPVGTVEYMAPEVRTLLRAHCMRRVSPSRWKWVHVAHDVGRCLAVSIFLPRCAVTKEHLSSGVYIKPP